MLGLLLGAALVVSYALLARDVLHGPVDDKSLAVSVRREAGAVDEVLSDDEPCRPLAPDAWMCAVSDVEDSGVVTYRVQMRHGSCWDAQLAANVSRSSRMPRAISGCVHRWQWSLTTV